MPLCKDSTSRICPSVPRVAILDLMSELMRPSVESTPELSMMVQHPIVFGTGSFLGRSRAVPITFRPILCRITEHPHDVPGQVVVDFAMPRHWLGHPGGRIAVPVMPLAMPDQNAPEPLDRRIRSTRFTEPPVRRPCGFRAIHRS